MDTTQYEERAHGNLTGVADPVEQTNEAIPLSHTIYLGGKFIGTLSFEKQGW